MRYLYFLSLVLLVSTQTGAAIQSTPVPTKDMPLETIQQIETLDKLSDTIDDFKQIVERMSRQKYSDCMKAFGENVFCTCLKKNLPVEVDFVGYVTIVTTTKEKFGYGQADVDSKQAFDNTLAAREVCVGSAK